MKPDLLHDSWISRHAVPKTVLVIDDDEASRELCALVLGQRGFSVLEASNGARGVAHAMDSPPDLILMDLEMPVMGGIEAILRLKADDRTRPVPIVTLSGAAKHVQTKAKLAGATACLAKPCSERELLKIVEDQLHAA